jgi:hypothetical protein
MTCPPIILFPPGSDFFIGDLKKKLEMLGLLHDSVVRQLIWKPEEKTIEFVVEDFYSNFEGQPEYPGLMGGSILLSNVQHIELDVDYGEKHLIIYELHADDVHPDNYSITVLFRPSGRIQVACGHVELPELGTPTPRRR